MVNDKRLDQYSDWDIVKATQVKFRFASFCISSFSRSDFVFLSLLLQYGVFKRCRELVEAGCDVRKKDDENVTLLHWAAINNRRDLATFYVEKGAELDAVGGKLQATPLHWAVRYCAAFL